MTHQRAFLNHDIARPRHDATLTTGLAAPFAPPACPLAPPAAWLPWLPLAAALRKLLRA